MSWWRRLRRRVTALHRTTAMSWWRRLRHRVTRIHRATVFRGMR